MKWQRRFKPYTAFYKIMEAMQPDITDKQLQIATGLPIERVQNTLYKLLNYGWITRRVERCQHCNAITRYYNYKGE